jgi:UDP-N-acetyl-2-amino-2-deoxyglucuronate dehydrogenase
MQKLKTAIIGTGKVAHVFANVLQSLPESQLVAVASRHLDRAQTFADKYGVRAFDSTEQLVRDARPDAVCIATPHPQHAGPAIACISAGIPVLIEKPLAATVDDCDRIIAAEKHHNVTVGVVSQRRFYEPAQRIRRAIDAGKIGKPIFGVVTMYGWRDEKYYKSDPWRGSWREEGGGVTINQAPHQLDLLLWYMGPVAEVMGMWANLNHPYIEVEDTAMAVLRFKSGALGQILVSNSVNPALYGRVQVNGHTGASIGVQTDGGTMFVPGMSKITEPPVNDLWTIPGEEHLLAQWKKEDADFFNSIDPIAHYHGLQIQDFLRAIIDRRPPLITTAAGRQVTQLIAAIYKSNETGAAIRL